MAQSQNQPLYWDKDRVPVNLTLILALGIALWGLYGIVASGGAPAPNDGTEMVENGEQPRRAPGSPGDGRIILILGIGVAAYTWLFTPRSYGVYADRLVIAYGRPRIKAMRFSDIDTVELGSMASLDRLRVRPLRGRRQSIRVRDVDTFYEHLEGALNAFRKAHPEYGEPLAPLPVDPRAAAAPAPPAEPESTTAAPDTPADSAVADAPATDSGADNPPPEHRPIY